jgi:ABC-2 type transport system ATP-binding protein
MPRVISITNLSKTYASGFHALRNVNLDIREGEILALLGPNGAGKTTLISIICGLVKASGGTVTVAGYSGPKDYRKVRAMIGLVPQELTTDSFESVLATVTFSRRLFGKKDNPEFIEKILRSLSLWEKKDNEVRTLSGGMKRRLLIAKALSHEPRILFLDEPTAGVDIELRKDMWQLVHSLRASGVTIILTTHYIDEAEAIADRIGVIDKGEIILVEEKAALMHNLGKKQLTLHLSRAIEKLPDVLGRPGLVLSADGRQLTYTYAALTRDDGNGIAALFRDVAAAGLTFTDLDTRQSRLEDIFVELVRQRK